MKPIKNYSGSRNKILCICLTLFLISISASAQESIWKIDRNHSKINFNISYFEVGEIKGVFESYTGSFIQEKKNMSAVNITIETASINTNQADRDKHLISTDFFSTEEYPKIKFTSTAIIKIASNEYQIKGNFTMMGITKPILLKAVDKGNYIHPRFKTTNKFITITGVIKREDFHVGTNYAPAKFALGKDVELTAEIHLTK